MISLPRGVTGFRAENVSDLVRHVGGYVCGPGPGQREPAFPSPRSQPQAARGPQHAALTTARALRGLRPPNHPQRQSSALDPTRATTPTDSAQCSRAAGARGRPGDRELQPGLARRPAARCPATQLTAAGVGHRPPSSCPDWGTTSPGRRRPGRGGDRVSAPRPP